MEFQSLNPIFPARDLIETRDFYEAIGFKTADLFEDFGYLIMCRDGAEVHFWRNLELDPKSSSHAGYLRLPKVDSLSAHLARLGLPSDQESIPRWGPAHDTPRGMRETIWVDPNGTLIRAGAFPKTE